MLLLHSVLIDWCVVIFIHTTIRSTTWSYAWPFHCRVQIQASPLISSPGWGANVAELQVSRSVRLGAGEELKGSSICCVDYCEEGMFPFVLVCTSSVFIALSVQLSFVHGWLVLWCCSAVCCVQPDWSVRLWQFMPELACWVIDCSTASDSVTYSESQRPGWLMCMTDAPLVYWLRGGTGSDVVLPCVDWLFGLLCGCHEGQVIVVWGVLFWRCTLLLLCSSWSDYYYIVNVLSFSRFMLVQ